MAQCQLESAGPRGPWYYKLSLASASAPPGCPISDWFQIWQRHPKCLLLESAATHPETGRYSFLTSDPVQWVQTRACRESDWRALQQSVAGFQTDAADPLPPFIGGVAGLLSYDWCRALEQVPEAARDDFQTPNFAMGVYDYSIAKDNLTKEVWLIATGFPEQDLEKRKQRAIERLQWILCQFHVPPTPTEAAVVKGRSAYHSMVLDRQRYHALQSTDFGEVLSATRMELYQQAILRAGQYLRAGDIFQVNLAQQLVTRIDDDAAQYYLRLRKRNPAPMMSYLDTGNHQVVSASPERLFSVRGRTVETRPIKGTCPRTGDVDIDRVHGQRLLASAKNGAENVMIVDLLRNDLSRVCSDPSVRVTALCQLEPYQYVQHLTSVVEGQLRPELSVWDVIPAIFPGGSITGAPKVRAMEIINELEPVARGAYCGSLGYIAFENQTGEAAADWNILIRTATVCGQWCQIPVGGGIVLDSDPELEFRETLTKARGMLLSLRCDGNPSTEDRKHTKDREVESEHWAAEGQP